MHQEHNIWSAISADILHYSNRKLHVSFALLCLNNVKYTSGNKRHLKKQYL